MNILISGGTGFVGSALTNALIRKGHHIFICTRSANKKSTHKQVQFVSYDVLGHLPNMDAVINLAGESLFGYWTSDKKEQILNSRTHVTRTLVEYIQKQTVRPKVFISGSAVGFYGTSEDKMYTEKTTQPGNDFLAEVASSWEKQARPVEDLGVRTVYTRFGVILGHGGALPLMELPVKLFVGGKVGTGKQWLSWVHVDDVVKSMIECMDNSMIEGPVNVTSPHPVRNDFFMKTIATSLGRPYWFPTPATAIRLALGEMSMLVVEGQYVLPHKLMDIEGFNFSYPNIENALRQLNGISS
ncbi:MAG TPA: TIGR01777 family oxidoreductase [Virgibacillus sp.]|nr:TIGR01777 family oxidoreductase [Virgibacillus sp.]